MAFIGLLVYGLLLTIAARDIWFSGGEWNLFRFPYLYSFTESVLRTAGSRVRLFEAVYFSLFFKLLGFNKLAWHLLALVLQASASMLMGRALQKVFPSRPVLVAVSVLFSFFLPPVASLTYTTGPDHDRLAAVLFWGSVVAFQRWAAGTRSWKGLAFPVLLYFLSTMTTEASSILVFAVPLFVAPVLARAPAGADGAQGMSSLAGVWPKVLLPILLFFVLTGLASTAGPPLFAGLMKHAYYSDAPIWRFILEGRAAWPLESYQSKAIYWGRYGFSLASAACLTLVFILMGRRERPRSAAAGIFRAASAVSGGFVLFLVVRHYLYVGGMTPMTEKFSSPLVAMKYFSAFGLFMVAPLREIGGDLWAWGLGAAILLLASVLAFRGTTPREPADGEPPLRYGVLLGFVTFALSTVPYLLAGYQTVVAFFDNGRMYMGACFGLAMLLGCLAERNGKRAKRLATRAVLVTILSLYAVFHVDLRRAWQESRAINCGLWTSLLSQVPAVEGNTTFLFVGLFEFIGNRASVFHGRKGLYSFATILYDRTDIDAYYLFRPEEDRDDDLIAALAWIGPEERRAWVTAEGIRKLSARAASKPPLSLDRLVIAERRGSTFHVLDTLSADEKKALITWDGVTSLHTNRDLVRPGPSPEANLRRIGLECAGVE